MGGEIKQIEDGGSVNDIVDRINEAASLWDEVAGPCNDLKKRCLKHSTLDKTAGSNIVHVVLGLCVASVADANMTLDQMKNQFKFTDKKPYLTMGAFEKYVELSNDLPDWISAYFDVVP